MKKNKAEKERIVLFDGVCNLCNSSVNFIIDHDRKMNFKFSSLQSEKATELLAKHSENLQDLKSVILIENGIAYEKSDAIFKIAKHLDGFWKYFYYFIYLPKLLRNFIYDLIAKSRYSIFGKRNYCRMPDENTKERFL